MTNEIISTSSSVKWKGSKPSEDVYTVDDVIRAFEVGKENGVAEANKRIYEKIMAITTDLWDVSNKLGSYLSDKGYNFHNIFLGIESEDHYKILIPVLESDLLRDEFMFIYDFCWELEEGLKTKHKNLDVLFHFSSYNEKTFDSESVVCDGYQFKFK